MHALRFLLSGPAVAIGCATILSGACAIDLKDDVAGKPCDENGNCLTGYECDTPSNTCVLRLTGAGGGATGGISDLDAAGARDASGGTTDAQGGSSTGGLSGTGGLSTGGTAGGDARADAPINEAAPDAPTTISGGIVCSGSTCSASDFCCVGQFPGYPNPPSDFSCKSEDAGSCQYLLQCDGDSDCPAQQVCCSTQSSGNWVARCASSCAAPDVHIGCIKPTDCSGGDQCCGLWSLQDNRITETICRSDCGNSFNDRLGCDEDADCSIGSCTDSSSLPGFRFCP